MNYEKKGGKKMKEVTQEAQRVQEAQKVQEAHFLEVRIDKLEKRLAELRADKETQKRLEEKYGKSEDSTLIQEMAETVGEIAKFKKELEAKRGVPLTNERAKKIFSKKDIRGIKERADELFE